MKNKVFINRLLNMRKIKYIGLDMDHTLIRYNTKEFEALVYEMLLEKLVKDKSYTADIKKMEFDFDQAIRGLVLDLDNGNILKLSRHGAIRRSYHGTRPIEFSTQKQLYRSHYVDLSNDNYIVVDTAFSISFCVLFGQLVDKKDLHPADYPSYREIALDISACLDQIHRDGSLKKNISADLDRFVVKDPLVVDGLKRYKKHGKKIFVATNSEYYYTKTLLDYAINPFLEKGETWADLFEYTITLAQKPRFFYDNLRFLKIDPETATMTNMDGKIVPGIYQGGSAKKFTDDLNLAGDDILYIGDHIYGDVLRLKKDCAWRTALVVEELETEVEGLIEAQPINEQIQMKMAEKEPFEQKNVELTTARIDEDSKKYDLEIQEAQKKIAQADSEISKLIGQQNLCFNNSWGQVFRAGAEESYFAHQVDRYACVYMAKLSDLLNYSPRSYFRAFMRPLSHEYDLTTD